MSKQENLDERDFRYLQFVADMEVLLEETADVSAEDLDVLTGDQRNEIYRMLRLEITPSGEGYAMSGVFRTAGLMSRGPRWA